MSSAKLTLIGFYQWYNNQGGDLFEGLVLPDGVEKEILQNNILLSGGEFESLYGDPTFVHDAIGLWSKKWYRTIEKWYAALQIEYDPLYNYDRYEEYSDTFSTDIHNKNSGDTTTVSTPGVVTTTETTPEVQIKTVEKVSAYNSSTMQDSTESTTGPITGATDTVKVTPKGKDEVKVTPNTDSYEYGKNTTDHTAHLYGNIGITTSSQLLTEHLNIQYWNLYEHITDLFLKEFVLPVY